MDLSTHFLCSSAILSLRILEMSSMTARDGVETPAKHNARIRRHLRTTAPSCLAVATHAVLATPRLHSLPPLRHISCRCDGCARVSRPRLVLNSTRIPHANAAHFHHGLIHSGRNSLHPSLAGYRCHSRSAGSMLQRCGPRSRTSCMVSCARALRGRTQSTRPCLPRPLWRAI